ncbi:hypothetical protein Tco_0112051 [Tanacetum coccineum]
MIQRKIARSYAPKAQASSSTKRKSRKGLKSVMSGLKRNTQRKQWVILSTTHREQSLCCSKAEFLKNSLITQEASGSLEDLEIIQEEDTHPSIDTSSHHEEDDLEIDDPQSAFYDYEILQMDVKTAFFNGYLSEEVYIEQPEEKVHTDDNLADPFTKALAFPKHSEHTKNIGDASAACASLETISAIEMLFEWRGIANMDFIQLGGNSRVDEMILVGC